MDQNDSIAGVAEDADVDGVVEFEQALRYGNTDAGKTCLTSDLDWVHVTGPSVKSIKERSLFATLSTGYLGEEDGVEGEGLH